MAEFIKAASLADVPPGSLLGVELDDGTEVCIANIEDEIYAFQDRCSHRDFPLSNGELIDDHQVQCAWHGARFDVKTGRALCLPAVKPIRTYEVKVEDGAIFVAV